MGKRKIRKEIIDLLNRSKKIALVTHKKPDGDGLGSLFALRLAFLSKKKDVKVFCADSPNLIFEFLPGFFDIQKEFDFKNFDILVFLDCANLAQAGFQNKEDFQRQTGVPTLNFDHHFSNESFCNHNLIDHSVGSTSEIIYELIQELDIEIDKDIATCLLCGVYWDTGGFIHDNTSASNLRLASQLILAGGRPRKIFKNIYGGYSLVSLKLKGKILANLKNKNGLTYSIITFKEMDELGATKNDLEGAVDLVGLVPGTKIALFIYQEEEEIIKGSLRTTDEDIDLTKLASFFGGGGHKKASGFRVKGDLGKNSEMEIIKVVTDYLKQKNN